MQNVFGIITHNKELITDRGNNKFAELSMDELDKKFDEIMSDFSKDYKEKNKISIRKKLNKQKSNDNFNNNNCYNYDWIKYSNYSKCKRNKNIELKLKENTKLLNHILPESKIGNLKRSNSNYNKLNKNLSLSYSSLTGRKKTKTPIRKSSIYGINNFEETSNKLIRFNCPIISKILYF